MKDLLNIKTEIVYQSGLSYDRNSKKSDMIIDICIAAESNVYLAGCGASVEYLNREKFAKNNIKVVFHEFKHPIYSQVNSREFVPGISILDMLFNCGIDETCSIFWANVNSTHEFDEIEA